MNHWPGASGLTSTFTIVDDVDQVVALELELFDPGCRASAAVGG